MPVVHPASVPIAAIHSLLSHMDLFDVLLYGRPIAPLVGNGVAFGPHRFPVRYTSLLKPPKDVGFTDRSIERAIAIGIQINHTDRY